MLDPPLIVELPIPTWPPVIMGLEFSGVVVEAGSAVTDYKIGNWVVAEPHTRACGKCELCREGNIQLCSEKRSPGWGIDGAFAHYAPMPEHLLHRIPDSMTYEEGALVEPAANVVQDVLERGVVVPDDWVVVRGPGPIGLFSVMAAKAGGAREVILIGTEADKDLRLPLGRDVGADKVVVVGEDNPIKAISEWTGGRGADLVVEASGAPQAIPAAPDMVRRLGRITAIGMTGGRDAAIPWAQPCGRPARSRSV
jgi:L-iditol 2-dehydrogenase